MIIAHGTLPTQPANFRDEEIQTSPPISIATVHCCLLAITYPEQGLIKPAAGEEINKTTLQTQSLELVSLKRESHKPFKFS